MELIDTHAHLASGQLRDETEELLNRAREASVSKVISISCDPEDSAENVRLAASHPGVFAAVGVHPTSVHEISEGWLEQIRSLAPSPRVVAIGEIGLDFYHPPRDGSSPESWRARQESVFRQQLDLARELDFPVVIHQRNSSEAVLEIMREYAGRIGAVFHCFSGSLEEARQLIDLGFHLSFTGIVTYKSATELADCAAALPLERIMVETDCPYLTPVPKRGKRNEPSYVRHTAEFLAERRGIPVEKFAEETSQTAYGFFRDLQE